jgi:hypothetical protein
MPLHGVKCIWGGTSAQPGSTRSGRRLNRIQLVAPESTRWVSVAHAAAPAGGREWRESGEDGDAAGNTHGRICYKTSR